MTTRRIGILVSTVILATACGGGTVTDSPGPVTPPSDTTKPGPPTVQRGAVSVIVDFDEIDRGIATRAGVSLASLQITLQSLSRVSANATVAVSADGRARFDSLLEGRYAVSVQRPLTTAEMERLSTSERWAVLFAGGREVIVSPPSVSNTTVTLTAPRRGSLIVSEVFLYRPGPPIFYSYGTYIELYNNADTTIYLDGMVLFRTTPVLHTSGWGACSQNAQLRADSAAIWTEGLFIFPGSGRDFPIAPGQPKVIAMDAMDHTIASPQTEQVDLSRADFEQIGNDSDIENPFVPNLMNLKGGAGVFGRGWPFEGWMSHGVALPLGTMHPDSSSALTRESDGLTKTLYRIPAARILDVVSLSYTPQVLAGFAQRGGTAVNCDPWLNSTFDRSAAYLVDGLDPRAIARRSLGRTSDGREILQRTQSSARDFDYASPLKRSLRR